MPAMKLPFKIDDAICLQLGYAPGAIALPTIRPDCMFVAGLLKDYSSLVVSREVFRLSGKRLVATGFKTYNLAGPVTAVDPKLSGMRVYADKLADTYEMDRETVVGVLSKPLEGLRKLCTLVLGEDLLMGSMVSGEMRVINRALSYLSEGKKDHARLFLQWPAFYQVFIDMPEIVDRSVAGESMWDLIPHGFDGTSVRELRKLKKFSTAWVDSGVPTDIYIRTLAKACSYLPAGAPRPESADEARSIIEMSSLCDAAFRSLGPGTQAEVKKALFAHSETWHGRTPSFSAEYAYDFIHYVYYNILVDAFRLNGIHEPDDARTAEAFFKIVGGNLSRIAQASKQWHARLPGLLPSGVGKAENWVAAVGHLQVPPFRTVDDDTGELVTNVYIFPMDSVADLAKEGNDQRHCVLSQARLCAEGQLRVVSIRQKIEDEYKTLSTASFYLEDGFMYIRDHRAFANQDPGFAAREALGWFEGQVNGGRPAFPFNRDWNPSARPVSGETLREALQGRFELSRPFLSKRMRERGFDELLAACA